MESDAILTKRCDFRKSGVTNLLTKRLWKALHLSSSMTLSQCQAGSCPNLMSENEVLGQKRCRESCCRSKPTMKTHLSPGLPRPSDGIEQYNSLVSSETIGAKNNNGSNTEVEGVKLPSDKQVKEAYVGGAGRNTGSLERSSLFCVSVSNSLSKSTASKSAESLYKPKSSSQASLFSSWRQNSHFEFDSKPLGLPDSANCTNGNHKSGASGDSSQRQLWSFSFSEPLITQVTDGIYIGNLYAAYNGQALCKNNIDNIIDMSSTPGVCKLNFIPCTCRRTPQHSWSRLRVHIQGHWKEEGFSLQEPCFWDINECIEASLEKRKRVLIHCRDGYSLAPTCVIQYLMVKHHMRLVAAYEFVRARYPVNIQECHQDLLVGLERSLWPGEVNTEYLKQAMSRKMAWT